MNKTIIKRTISALALCGSLSLYGCSSSSGNESNISPNEIQQSTPVTSESASSEDESKLVSSNISSEEESIIEEIPIDYGDAESFEIALNKGENLEGKIVCFVAKEFHPDSKLGYNVWAGEHLNFISSRNPDIKEGDTVTVKVITIENLLGSWIIKFEKVENAVMDKNTITYSQEQNDPSSETKSSNSDVPTENDTYEHNQYYDIVETASFKNSIGYTILIHKVLAKKNISISSSLLAYGEDHSVIGKSSDDIVLTEGEYNFFRYSFEEDITNANIKANANAKTDSFLTGERNAVQMVQYNQSGDNLYITLKQNVDELSNFAKFKILFYKGDKIVNSESGYFSTYTKNLNGKDSTDVAEIWVYGIDFDEIDYIFEP